MKLPDELQEGGKAGYLLVSLLEGESLWKSGVRTGVVWRSGRGCASKFLGTALGGGRALQFLGGLLEGRKAGACFDVLGQKPGGGKVASCREGQ